MYRKIAVDDGLTNVSQALQAAGFHTMPLHGDQPTNVEAVVVKGDSSESLALQAQFGIPVVHASGRSAAEVVEVVRDRLS